MTIIYILGAGRSGSTLLDQILGQGEQCTSAGELQYIWQRGFINNELCACGRAFDQCTFWSQIKTNIDSEFDSSAIEDVAYIVGLAISPKKVLHNLIFSLFHSRRKQKAKRLVQKLYSLISEQSQSLVVDSSKEPLYLLFLHTVLSEPIKTIHLVRDPRAVGFSWAAKKERHQPGDSFMVRHSYVASSIRWMYRNISSILASKIAAKLTVFVRYEDLMYSPKSTLKKIWGRLSLAEDLSMFESDSSINITANHAVAGNPSRFKRGSIPLLLDQRWVNTIDKSDARKVIFFCWPLMKLFEYPCD